MEPWTNASSGNPGATAKVEETPDGTRITLRPRGAGRWLVVGFLGLWLTGWAFGEVFAIGALLAIAGAALDLPLFAGVGSIPAGGFGIGAAIFLLVWLTFWTIGGAAALYQALRLGWGRDVFTLRPDGWSLKNAAGPWGRERSYGPGRVRAVRAGQDSGLVADTERGTVKLTRLGTDTDRLWLADRLRQAAGVRETGPGDASPRSASPPMPELPHVPRGWVADRADGHLRVTRGAGARAAAILGLLFVNAFWNGIVGVFVAGGLGMFAGAGYEGPSAMAPGRWGYWLFLTPFLTAGVVMLAALIQTAIAREEWLAGPDWLEVRQRYPGWSTGRRFVGGVFVPQPWTDSEGGSRWRLRLEAPGQASVLHTGAEGEVRDLARLLAAETGWSVRERVGELVGW